jgi:hypothetical protein
MVDMTAGRVKVLHRVLIPGGSRRRLLPEVAVPPQAVRRLASGAAADMTAGE